MDPEPKKNNHLLSVVLACFLLVSLCLTVSAATAPTPNKDAPTPPSDAAGNDRNDEKPYRSLFRKLFYSSVYNSLKCYENIYTLLKKAETEALDLTQVKVIFIFDKNHDKLLPSSSSDKSMYSVQRPTITLYKTRIVYNRSDPPGEFRFHVIASYQDKIMDFDYTNSPKLVPAREYFNHMFSSEKMTRKERKNLFQKLMLRVIPAQDYLQNSLQHTSWYLFDLETKFPSQSLNRYLLTIDKPPPKEEPCENDT